jgi:hypothetical protein
VTSVTIQLATEEENKWVGEVRGHVELLGEEERGCTTHRRW